MRTAATQYKNLTLADISPTRVSRRSWKASDSESWKGSYHLRLSTVTNLKARPVTGANRKMKMTRTKQILHAVAFAIAIWTIALIGGWIIAKEMI